MSLVLGDWLAARLNALGVRRVYGAPLRGLVHAPVRDPSVARRLAAIDGAVLGGLGVAWDGDGLLYVGSAPGATHSERRVSSADELAFVLHDPPGRVLPSGLLLRIGVHLDEPAPRDRPPPWPRRFATPQLDRRRRVIVVGSGAVRSEHAADIAKFVDRTGYGVVATLGGVGLLAPGHPQFLGVVGLQARDLALGVAGAEQLITIGVDNEMIFGGFASIERVDVDPATVADLTIPGPEASDRVLHTELRDGIARALAGLQSEHGGLKHAVKASAEMHRIVPADVVIAADAGMVGFWAVRTLTGLRRGGAIVPSTVVPGFAAAASLVCQLDGRRALGVTTYPVDGPTARIVEVARSMGGRAAVMAWGQGAPEMDGATHERVVREVLARTTPVVSPVGVTVGSTSTITDVAGPITAWPGGTVEV